MNPQSPGILVPIQSVHIENFRGVRDLEVKLDPDVTVFFGFNAAGKSTLLDAIAFGLSSIVSVVGFSSHSRFEPHEIIRVPHKDREEIGEKAGVRLPFVRVTMNSSSGPTWDVHALRCAADHLPTPAIGAADASVVLAPIARDMFNREYETNGAPSPIPLVAAYGAERTVDVRALDKRNILDSFGRLQAFEHSLNAATQFRTAVEWFWVVEDVQRRERERRRDFDYLHPALEWVRRAIERSGLRCKNPHIEIKPHTRMVVDYQHYDGSWESLDVSSLSGGYRTHFALVVDIARRMVQLNPSDDLGAPDRGTNSEAVILIDEIDLHLDPTWQAIVVQGLRSAFPRAQFVLTTHSEQVIGSVPASSVRRLVVVDGEILAENVPFAQGASGERILIELMGAKERVPGPVTSKLDRYVRLVDRGEGRGAEALELRSQLELAIRGDERLHDADLEMEKRRLIAKLAGAKT